MARLEGAGSAGTAPGVPAGEAPPCPNCGTPVADQYCPHCGQHRRDSIPSLRRMAADFVEDQLAIDGRLPRTLGGLLFRPGFLTREWREGRIARYVRPFRLFLISSVLFFVAVSIVADPARLTITEEGTAWARTETGWDNVSFGLENVEVPRVLKPLADRLQAQEERLNSLPPREAVRVVFEAMTEGAARSSFFLVPAFAGLLQLLHFRRRIKYVEHFVFALHYHAMAFLLLTPAILISNGLLTGAVALWIMVYLLIALKRAYGQPWWLATGKYFVLTWAYSIVLGMVTALAVLLAVLLS